MAKIKPTIADIRPFTISLLQRATTMQRPITPSAKYSQAPKIIATLASQGAIRINAIPANNPPINDAKTPRESASPGLPCFAIGEPSKVVTILDGVPGLLSNTADTKPPEMPPTKIPISVAIPVRWHRISERQHQGYTQSRC